MEAQYTPSIHYFQRTLFGIFCRQAYVWFWHIQNTMTIGKPHAVTDIVLIWMIRNIILKKLTGYMTFVPDLTMVIVFDNLQNVMTFYAEAVTKLRYILDNIIYVGQNLMSKWLYI